MSTQFVTIGLLMFFSAMLPGPDFALVVKNTVLHSRRAGFATSFGIGCAILVHISYCVLGLAVVIAHSMWAFNAIKYVGSAYLFVLGAKMCLSRRLIRYIPNTSKKGKSSSISVVSAFMQGFLCNLLNPKATMFFLALFTIIVKPGTSYLVEALYALEMFLILTGWFCFLTLVLSHKSVMWLLERIGPYFSRVLGLFLIGFGLMLFLVKLKGV